MTETQSALDRIREILRRAREEALDPAEPKPTAERLPPKPWCDTEKETDE